MLRRAVPKWENSLPRDSRLLKERVQIREWEEKMPFVEGGAAPAKKTMEHLFSAEGKKGGMTGESAKRLERRLFR